MFAAYCDESYRDSPQATPFYVVAGFCGPLDRWANFERYWKGTMRELRITDIGLHASKCANGAKPYHRMSRERRDDIQHRLIVDIAASRLMGFVAAIDMPAFRARQATLQALYGKHDMKYAVPHVYAMQDCVLIMTEVTEFVTDRIAFVFDRNKEFGGRAREWYQRDVKRPLMEYHTRLGSFTDDDRLNAVGLQAADLLAYSAFRNLSEPTRDRWQWKELHQATHIVQWVSDEKHWRELEDEGLLTP